jgi:opacity protein-like surface antigen
MKTFRVLSVLVLGLLFAGVAAAQSQETPTVELFGGYTFIHVNVGNVTIATDGGAGLQVAKRASATSLVPTDPHVTSNLQGGSGSLTFNVNNWFGLAADFGGSKISSLNASGLPSVNVDSTLFTYLFGPRFSYRGYKKVTPFAQVLFGGAHITDVTASGMTIGGPPTQVTIAKSANAFAMAVGGGFDWNVQKHVAIRVVQVEYLMTRFTNPFSLTGATGTQNNLRVSAGIVFRLGTK